MAQEYVSAFLSCDTPGVRSTVFGNGSDGYTTITLEGWRHFSDYLVELETAIKAISAFNYEVAYDSATNPDRVEIIQDGGSAAALTFETLSLAYALGFSQKASSTPGDHVGSLAPLAAVPIGGHFFKDRRPARTYDLAERRFGRNTNVAWGSGELATLVMTLEWDKLYRIMDGPCRSGKIRVGGLTSDYTDVFVASVRAATREGSTETVGRVEMDVYIPEDQSHTVGSTASFTDPWTLVERGYTPSYFLKIEGLPFLFCETKASTLGISHSTHTEAQSLIIDDSSAFREKINREQGIVDGGAVKVGFKDSTKGALDVHGIFGSPEGRAVLDGTINEYDFGGGASATQAVNVENITTSGGDAPTAGFGSSGFCYLGKECLQFSAKGSTSLTCNFQTRGAWGSTYRHGDHTGPTTHRILSSRPIVWHGRIAELWVCFVDPIAGLPSMSAWEEEGNQLMVGLFEVRGTPGFDRGLWTLELRPLTDRLKRKPISTYGQLQPYAGVTKTPSDLWVTFDGFATFEAWNVSTGNWQNHFTLQTSTYTLPYMSLVEGLTKWIAGVEQTLNTDTLGGTLYDGTGGNTKKLEVTLGKITLGSGGMSFEYTVDRVSSYSSIGTRISRGFSDLAFLPSHWEIEFTTAASNFPYTYSFQTTLDGLYSPAVVVAMSSFEGIDATDWPAPSATDPGPFYASIDGKETISYNKVYTSTTDSAFGTKLVALGGVKRGVLGGDRVDLFAGGTVSAGNTIFPRPIHDIMSTMVESSGLKAASGSAVSDDGPRGSFDEMDTIGAGYGIDDQYWDGTQHPLDPGFNSSHMVVHDGPSLVSLVGGYMYANNLAIGPKRSGNRIKLGTISTLPFAPAYDATLRDSDLLLKKNVASVRQFSPRPNSVKLARSVQGFNGGKDTVQINELDDIVARGRQASNVSLPGLAESDFFAFSSAVGRGMVTQHESASVYAFKVRPTQDWRVGMSLDISVTYPGIFDMSNNQAGLVGKGRVLELSRNLRTGEVDLVVMMGVGSAPLSYSATVTGIAGNVYTLDVFETEDGDPLFDRLEYVRVHNPGKSNDIDESLTITAVDSAAKTITLSGSLGFTAVTNYTQITFLHQEDGNISTRQQEFCHFNDGTRWM